MSKINPQQIADAILHHYTNYQRLELSQEESEKIYNDSLKVAERYIERMGGQLDSDSVDEAAVAVEHVRSGRYIGPEGDGYGCTIKMVPWFRLEEKNFAYFTSDGFDWSLKRTVK